MTDIAELVADFARRHIVWAPVIAFVVAFLESLPFVGLFVPGTSLLIGLGAIAAFSGGSVPATLVAAAAGAILGAWGSYEIGRSHFASLQDHPFITRRPKLLAACESLFRRHGPMSIAIARFLPVLRPMTPMVAGAFGLEPRRFHPINLMSAVLWAPAFILPGAVAGSIASLVGGRALLPLLVLVGVLAATIWSVWRLRSQFAALPAHGASLRQAALRHADLQPRWWTPALRVGLGPAWARRRRALFGVFVAALLILYVFSLGADVLSRRPVVQADLAIANLLWSLRTPWLDRTMVIVSALGDGSLRAALAVAVVAWLAWRGQFRWAGMVAAGMTAVAVAVPALKVAFKVARPTPLYTGVDAFSFPSGHAASAAVVFLVLGWIAVRSAPAALRLPIWLLSVAAILLTGASRIYLGAHWPSDVVAGLALGGAIAAAAIAFAPLRDSARSVGALPAGVVALCCLVVVSVAMGPMAARGADQRYRPYLSHDAVRTVSFDSLQQGLQPVRTDLLGQPEEHLSALWIGDLAVLRAELEQVGWREAVGWRPATALRFLDATSDLRTLPPAPVLHDGRLASLTLRGPLTSRDSGPVLRFWPAGVKVSDGGRVRFVYVGSITRETSRRPLGLITTITAEDDHSFEDANVSRLAPSVRLPQNP